MQITREMNIRGYSAILASITYYLQTIGCEMPPVDLVKQITDDFWLKTGFMSSNRNRPQMVYDLSDQYQIPNRGYDDIFSHMREPYRPEEEIAPFEALLQEMYPAANGRP